MEREAMNSIFAAFCLLLSSCGKPSIEVIHIDREPPEAVIDIGNHLAKERGVIEGREELSPYKLGFTYRDRREDAWNLVYVLGSDGIVTLNSDISFTIHDETSLVQSRGYMGSSTHGEVGTYDLYRNSDPIPAEKLVQLWRGESGLREGELERTTD